MSAPYCDWVELNGAAFRVVPGWQVAYSTLDDSTGLLQVVTEHRGRGLLKAELLSRFDAEAWPTPRWDGGSAEALFGSGQLEEAVNYLRDVLRQLEPKNDPRP